MTRAEKKIYEERPDIKEKVENAIPIKKNDCPIQKHEKQYQRMVMAKRIYNENGTQNQTS
jgi:hypothetical protein